MQGEAVRRMAMGNGFAGIDGGSAGGRLTVDLGAVRQNYRRLAERAAPAVCGAVVKADAYGLGADRIVPALFAAGCREFFVAQLCEGLALARLTDGRARITIMNGLQPGGEAPAAAAKLRPALNSLEQVRAYADVARATGQRLDVAIQVDSGMSRLGLSPEEVGELLRDPTLLSGLSPSLVMSHLASADDPRAGYNETQRANFEALAGHFPGVARSLSNSGGTLLGDLFRFDLVRPGLALYGVPPTDDPSLALSPVIAIEGRVVQTRSVPAGTPVGYGCDERVARASRLATISLGYADGLPRSLQGRGAVWFQSHRLRIVGRVSMDSIVVDATDLAADALTLGTSVEIVGPNQSLETLAHDADTIAYEILTSIGRRYERVYLDAA